MIFSLFLSKFFAPMKIFFTISRKAKSLFVGLHFVEVKFSDTIFVLKCDFLLLVMPFGRKIKLDGVKRNYVRKVLVERQKKQKEDN
jgi:hypothetical protein